MFRTTSRKPPKASEPASPPAENTAAAFRGLYSYARPHSRKFALVLVCTLLAISGDLLQPFLVKIAIDDHLAKGAEFGALGLLALVYLILSLTSFLFSYLQDNLLQQAGQSVVAGIRKDLFRHILRQSVAYYDRTPSGSLITYVSSDTESLNQFFTGVLLSLVRDGMTLLFIIVLMFQLDVTMTLYCLLLLPLIAGIAIGFRAYLRRTYQLSRTQLSRLIAFTAENLSGMQLIQAFHQEKEQQTRFLERNDGYYRANLREIRTNVLFNRSFDVLGNLSVAFVTWLGGYAVLGHSIEFGVLYAFITYIRQFFQPINNITQQWNQLQSATVSVNRIWSVFSQRPVVRDPEHPVPLVPAEVQGRIDFERISFHYGEEGPDVIQDLDLHIRPGEMIGIVGTTGAGKSSLISLLCRFYDVQKGSIRIDGTDIRDIEPKTLHRLVGLVQQEPYLYSGSILDNVRLFDPSISAEAVQAACRRVGAHAMILRLKDGYETRVSERGSGLSAGERQLISFARILVFEPRILILDEATANLDSHTELMIQKALQEAAKGRTTLIIAHRLSTITGADRILVMRQGRIAEEGSHRELLELGGHYWQLHRYGRSPAAGAG
ncbi:ABC transporter ATP-binding protein [Paenibacillus mucilaginosus]|uniref:ABC transporter related protein n=1 Tax=Paenibacillus mucilaginosus (strain KNP414) TaxID=1036673 RepID=F8F9C3_PAEMK|nr:ABC transporter ATP-binding protein [Paenibacillus mucilaginosus]AEI43051.1 ABC transporter related protein [Paenibacillus mucilaginosus KNP414]MCG7215990.1 ABC transporter ATP-binding protein/permease [Paenibacillus mucilaginosus]WDM24673.1 ABC transporter ATP-binding protein [Paenibacillus mucilaginosus]